MILNDVNIRALFEKLGRTYAPDTLIFLEEEKGDEMYIIVSGEVEIMKTYKEQEIFGGARLTLGSVSDTIAVLKSGDFFGEMALWNDAPRMATARARTQVEAIVLRKPDLELLVMKSPAMAIQMLRSLCDRLREVSQSPRLEAILPKIQEIILNLQNRRTVGPKKETGTKPVEPIAPKEKSPSNGAIASRLADEIVAAKVRTCLACAYPARAEDRFCGRCGKPLA